MTHWRSNAPDEESERRLSEFVLASSRGYAGEAMMPGQDIGLGPDGRYYLLGGVLMDSIKRGTISERVAPGDYLEECHPGLFRIYRPDLDEDAWETRGARHGDVAGRWFVRLILFAAVVAAAAYYAWGRM